MQFFNVLLYLICIYIYLINFSKYTKCDQKALRIWRITNHSLIRNINTYTRYALQEHRLNSEINGYENKNEFYVSVLTTQNL